ncbi:MULTISPECIES: transcription elongation factor GreB [unclassified Idiomarina]|jgi:transcription elongation factor GreB|uniref:transcription elongation factor GreB n=1 Tax=unclassified Idiomarina TaxID=2614829 RepID=UPI0008F86BD3|nr:MULTISPECIES: transcription elongation factor GreB [unclassified Idiomarina]MAD53495.1 transcription elongation factor GreB [Idiomarinaceae bacterium]OIM99211.1 transcription elongation factor GreB [Idiomarina sp. MD25a]|tara:strand:+ start:12486 stop:12998 length:513 start_codon:yes stop_codon:yes gene_type:complete
MKTNLITRNGFDKLQQELNHLWRVERRETVEKVSWAASLGDRSENADYKYNKQKLRRIDSRIRYLSKRLDQLKVVDYSPQQDGQVFFGAFVEIEDEQGTIRRFQIVGPDEIYDSKDVVSIDAPMARALLKKHVDDEVIVVTPKGEQCWFINKIQYHAFSETDCSNAKPSQ